MKGRTGSRPCMVHGCPELRPCPTPGHEPVAWAGSDRRQRLPKDWNKRVRYIRRRDPICTECWQEPTTEVDHIIPNDDHRYTNLRGIGRKCHGLKSAREGVLARQRKRPT